MPVLKVGRRQARLARILAAALLLCPYAVQRLDTRAAYTARAAVPIHVAGNELVDARGARVILRGANRSGTEYQCIDAPAFADGPTSGASLAAMRAWGFNAVRVPLNEDCWLGINGVRLAGTAYQADVARYVRTIVAGGMYPILDLHISAPATLKATGQQPMPDADHAVAFWRSVAGMFGHDAAVIFDLFNEPFPDGNGDSTAAWTCWRDGCRETTGSGQTYRAAGMQALVDAVRGRGARNVLMLGGIQFAGTIDRWPAYRPHDPLHNLAAAQHFYANGACASSTCWTATTAAVARRYPVVAGEVGDTDCTVDSTAQVLGFLETHRISYLVWDWGPDFGCQSLIKSFNGLPSQPYGQWIHDWVLRAGGRPIVPSPLATFYDSIGVVKDGLQAACGFDDQNYCYSSQALAQAGLPPGDALRYNGATFTWGTQPGVADNVVANGQTVAVRPAVPGSPALNVLGAATHGPARGTVILTYTDGTTARATLDLSDWTLTAANGSAQAAEPGNSVLLTAHSRDKSDGTAQSSTVYLFGVSLPLDTHRTLASIRLPGSAGAASPARLHIFDLASAPVQGR